MTYHYQRWSIRRTEVIETALWVLVFGAMTNAAAILWNHCLCHTMVDDDYNDSSSDAEEQYLTSVVEETEFSQSSRLSVDAPLTVATTTTVRQEQPPTAPRLHYREPIPRQLFQRPTSDENDLIVERTQPRRQWSSDSSQEFAHEDYQEPSILRQELEGQRRRHNDAPPRSSSSSIDDEALARRLAAQLNSEPRYVQADQALAARLAAELNDQPMVEDEPQDEQLAAQLAASLRVNDVTLELPDAYSIEEQRRILERIQRENEQRQLQQAMSVSAHNHRRSSAPPSMPPRPASDHDERPWPSEPPRRTGMEQDSRNGWRTSLSANDERYLEAFERQFRPRGSNGGSNHSTPPRPTYRSSSLYASTPSPLHRSLLSASSHSTASFGGLNTSNHSYSSVPRYSSSTSTDWETSQHLAMAEYQRSQSAYPWQPQQQQQPPQRIITPTESSPLYPDLSSHSAHYRRSDLLSQGVDETARAVREGRAHIVQCQGCYTRLQAPIDYALVYCPSCGVVSPGISRMLERPRAAYDGT